MKHSKELLEFTFSLDFYEGEIIKTTKQYYIIRIKFGYSFCIIKVRKKNLENKTIYIGHRLKEIFEKYRKYYNTYFTF